MNNCKIVRGTAFNIKQNRHQPLAVLDENILAINELLLLTKQRESRVCFVGSSCMYPVREGALREEMLGTGEIYEGNALYGYTKLLGWQICRAAAEQLKLQWFTVIPSDMFGESSSTHFIADMMRKMHRAKEENAPVVTFWGTGTPIRHPIWKDDYERILQRICETYDRSDSINIATPVSYAKSIASIALDIQDIVGYKGDIEWDAAMPDGQKVKILDNSKLTKLGYAEFIPWKESLEKAYDEIKANL